MINFCSYLFISQQSSLSLLINSLIWRRSLRSSQCDEVSVNVLLPLDYTQQIQVYQKVPESEKSTVLGAADSNFRTGYTFLWERYPFIVYFCFLRRPTVFTLSLGVSKDGVQIFALNNGTAGPCVSQYTRSRQRVNCLLFCNTLTCTILYTSMLERSVLFVRILTIPWNYACVCVCIYYWLFLLRGFGLLTSYSLR